MPGTDLQDLWLRRAASFAAPVRVVGNVWVGFVTLGLGRLHHLKVSLPHKQWTCMQNLDAAAYGVFISSQDTEALECLHATAKTCLRLGALKIGLIDEQRFMLAFGRMPRQPPENCTEIGTAAPMAPWLW